MSPADRRIARRRSQNVDARTDIDANEPFDFEGDQCLAHTRAGNVKAVGKIAFGRQATADRVFTVVDQLTKLLGNLSIEPTRLNGLEGQGASPTIVPYPKLVIRGRPLWIGPANFLKKDSNICNVSSEISSA